jgi:hypothetical protein
LGVIIGTYLLHYLYPLPYPLLPAWGRKANGQQQLTFSTVFCWFTQYFLTLHSLLYMHVAFDNLPPRARVWIYQASRPLDEAELVQLLPRLAAFAEEWTSHGRQLAASAQFLHRQFLVIGLDEEVSGASGCSIDASVRFVQELEQRLGVTLLEKSRMAFLAEGELQTFTRRELREAIAAGQITADTPYFNNTLATKGELDAHWPAPAGQTWLSSYFAG